MSVKWNESRSRALRLPTSESGWRDEYQRRMDAYHLEPYTKGEADAYHLFSAFDVRGEEIAQTRRTFRDYAFIIDRAAESLFGGGLSLELQGGVLDDVDDRAGLEASILAEGQAVLDRSKFDRWADRLAWMCAIGRAGIECVRTSSTAPYRTKLVVRDPRVYACIYDDMTETELDKVIVTNVLFESEQLDQRGDVIANADGEQDTSLNIYRRVLTRDRVDVTVNDQNQDEESGEHGLDDAVPFVNLVWGETSQVGHGNGTGRGILSVLAAADSLSAQVHAIATRYGDPKPYIKGATLSASPTAASTTRKVGVFGYVLHGLPADAEVGYWEPKQNTIGSMLEAIGKLLDRVRHTFPVFAVYSGGASASGEALRTRSAAYMSEVLRARAAILPELSRAIDMAVAMDRDVPYSGEDALFKLVPGPVFPADLQKEIETLEIVRQANLITPADYVRHMQRLGVVDPDRDPSEYAMEAMDAGGAAMNVFGGARDASAVAESARAVEALSELMESTEEASKALDEASRILSAMSSAPESERGQMVADALRVVRSAADALPSIDDDVN